MTEAIAPCCRISLRPLLDLGEREGPGAIGTPRAVARDERGYDYVVSEETSSEIVVFDDRGRYLRTLGRKGAGPGEFQFIATLLLLPADTLWVFDARAGRVTVFDPEGDLVTTIPFRGNVHQAILLRDGRIAVAGLVGTDSTSEAIHLLDRTGSITGSFGTRYRRGDFRSFYPSRRVIAAAAGAGLWAAQPLEYRIERWHRDSLDHAVERHAEWFPPRTVPATVTPDRPPSPEIRAMQEDATGVLWILITIGEPKWYEGLAERPAMTADGPVYRWEDLNRVLGTRIEAIDAANGALLASSETDELFIGFLAPGRAVAYREDRAGYPVLRVYELRLERAPARDPGIPLPGYPVGAVLAIVFLFAALAHHRRAARRRGSPSNRDALS